MSSVKFWLQHSQAGKQHKWAHSKVCEVIAGYLRRWECWYQQTLCRSGERLRSAEGTIWGSWCSTQTTGNGSQGHSGLWRGTDRDHNSVLYRSQCIYHIHACPWQHKDAWRIPTLQCKDPQRTFMDNSQSFAPIQSHLHWRDPALMMSDKGQRSNLSICLRLISMQARGNFFCLGLCQTCI